MCKYTAETKAAVMAALLAGQSVNEVARAYNLPTGTVKSWKSREITNGNSAATPKKQIGELVLAYLRENLLTLQAQAKVFRNEEWLAAQSADQLAVLHGVMADKSIRLLEAFADAEESEPAV